ncbi:hypothetical protein [Hoeflea sp.]|uniref:hypothetical protein n=1 Tax=Hoeflea sp. TaxID=1940281 RepID=UPI003B52FBED
MSVSELGERFFSRNQSGEEQLPALFVSFASLAFVLVLLSIVISVHLSPPGDPAREFGAQGLNTALKSLLAAMSAMAAVLVFYIRTKRFDRGALLWPVIAVTCMAFALEIGWNGGLFNAEALLGGWAGAFGLGAATFVFLALFGREIRTCQTFLVLFSVAAGFIILNVAIGMAVPVTPGWKQVVVEGFGLIGAFFLFLAVSARLVLLIDQLSARRRFG